MTTQYEKAKSLVAQGLLSCKVDPNDPNLEIFCYTKEAFFGKNWNEITLSHRGQLYYDGVPVNKPFNKIFNVGEVENTKIDCVIQKMKTNQYKIHHKANGHLFIVSRFFVDGEERIVYSTKGSLPSEGNDLLNKDIEVFERIYGDALKSKYWFCPNNTEFTLMFEAIVSHDKHVMFEKDLERYGRTDDVFILLGGYFQKKSRDWVMFADADLMDMEDCGFDIVKDYSKILDHKDPLVWLNHDDIEGYVIVFDDGQRVKFKTKEYWKLRLKRDLSPEMILRKFRQAGFDRLDRQLPEEIAVKAVEVIKFAFGGWCYDIEWGIDKIAPLYLKEMSMEDVMAVEELTMIQKHGIAAYRKYGDSDELIERQAKSRERRQKFFDYVLSNKLVLEWFEFKLVEIFEGYGR